MVQSHRGGPMQGWAGASVYRSLGHVDLHPLFLAYISFTSAPLPSRMLDWDFLVRFYAECGLLEIHLEFRNRTP